MQPTGIFDAGIFGLGGQEVVVILLLALVLFGGKKMGELGKGLGEGIRNFKTGLKGDEEVKVEEKKQA